MATEMPNSSKPGNENPFAAPEANEGGDWRHRTRWQIIRTKLLALAFFVVLVGFINDGRMRGALVTFAVTTGIALIATAADPRLFAIRWDAHGLSGPDMRSGRLRGTATIDFGRRVRVRTFHLVPQTEVEDDQGNRVTLLHAYISRADREELRDFLAHLYPSMTKVSAD